MASGWRAGGLGVGVHALERREEEDKGGRLNARGDLLWMHKAQMRSSGRGTGDNCGRG